MSLFMNISDKIVLEQELYCPPHCLPHKLPFTKPITKERCHIHNKKWRMLHHINFCYFLNCPNFKKMLECGGKE